MTSKENEGYAYKSLDISEEREDGVFEKNYSILEKQEVKSGSEGYDPLSSEDMKPFQNNTKLFRKKYIEKKGQAFSNGSQPSRTKVLCDSCSKNFTN